MKLQQLHESPSFFKVLMMGFNHQLRIPPDFSRELERVLVASTRTTLRVSSGATWDVKVEKMGDGNYKFTEGWGEFARDVGLQLGEFMAFWLVGESLFDVAIFATLRKNFREAAGLLGKRSVDLVYLPKNHKQHVVIDHRRPGNRLDLAAGWATFQKANGLVIGKAYSFEFKPGKNVIQVQKLKTVK
ncbi:Putative B3 domain-containing protein [Striga hermonthica]|uniref:B3 domain-containing protein n=1 Tax=Striga hermonthica TaxID=68872 RepID=A0A9N7RPQ4_STRHE|nr:Putative B3 domain-containing protein [Striga hermonthica]